MRKRGQITIYIVFGILLAVIAVLLILSRRGAEISDFEQRQLAAMIVPEKAKEVQRYVQNCVKTTAEDGVRKLGLQGGYINLPSSASIPNPAYPFTTNLEIFPGGSLKTAYWFYVAPNGLQKSNMPTIEKMETELADYMNSNLASCLNNFTLFASYNVTTGAIRSSVNIDASSVQFTVDYPVKIRVLGFEYEIPSFYAKVNSRIGEMYAMGKEIIEKGNSDFFLEEKTIDILAMYAGIPYSGTEFTCTPHVWTKSKVLAALKDALATNMQFIKIKGTEFTGKEQYFVWDALRDRHKGISASFRYSAQWPVKMDVSPSEGEILRAKPMMNVGNQAMAYLTSLFCITDYNFVYDISYPVLISLSDENGNLLQFATMVIIDNNQPRENKLGTLDIPAQDKKICSNAITPAAIYALASDAGGRLNPVDGAKIKVKCVSTICDLGYTKTDKSAREPLLKAYLPQCVNALLTAEKEGYHTAKLLTDTVEQGSYSLVLEPLKTLDYEIKVLENGMERNVDSEETAIIEITDAEKGFATTLTSPSGKVDIIPGNLKIKSILITQGFDIPIRGKEITHCFKVPTRNILGLLGFDEEKCVTARTEDMTLDQVIMGGSETLWRPGRNSLSSASKVTFYIPAGKLPTNIDELEQAYASSEDPTKAVEPLLE